MAHDAVNIDRLYNDLVEFAENLDLDENRTSVSPKYDHALRRHSCWKPHHGIVTGWSAHP
jgi:hypothetical protein